MIRDSTPTVREHADFSPCCRIELLSFYPTHMPYTSSRASIPPTDTINEQPGGFEHHSLTGTTGWHNKWSPDHQYQTLSSNVRWDWQQLAFPGHPCHCVLHCFVSTLHAVLQRKVLVKLCTWKRQILLGNIWLEPHMSHTTRWGHSGSCKCQGRSTTPMQFIWMKLFKTDFGGDFPVGQWQGAWARSLVKGLDPTCCN